MTMPKKARWEHAASLLRRALTCGNARTKAGHRRRGAALSGDLLQLEQALPAVTARDWDRVQERICACLHLKARPLRERQPQKSAVQALRKSARAIVEELRDRQFCASSAEFFWTMWRFAADGIAAVRSDARLTLFTEQKQQKYLMDFSDMGLLCNLAACEKSQSNTKETELAQEAGALYDEGAYRRISGRTRTPRRRSFPRRIAE